MLVARVSMLRGRVREIDDALEASVRADPVGLGTRWYYVVNLYCVGKFQRCIDEADRMLSDAGEYNDALRWRGKARCALGDVAGGLEDLERAAGLTTPHPWHLAELSIALSANGRTDEVRRGDVQHSVARTDSVNSRGSSLDGPRSPRRSAARAGLTRASAFAGVASARRAR